MASPNNHNQTPESPSEPPRFDRADVIAAFQKFVERGVPSPDHLDPEDPDVVEANRILDSWSADNHKISVDLGTVEAKIRFSIERSTVLLAAGFSGPDYLDEVANDWLGGNDLADAEAAGLTELAAEIRALVDAINNRL